MSYPTTPSDLVALMFEAGNALDTAQAELSRCVREEADAETEYRKAKANAYLGTSGTVGERDAQVDKTVADERHRAHLAEGLSKSALEAVRNKRTQLSVLQTMANSLREEAAVLRTGPELDGGALPKQDRFAGSPTS